MKITVKRVTMERKMYRQSHFPFWEFRHLHSATKPDRDYKLWRTGTDRIFYDVIWKLYLLQHSIGEKVFK